MDSLMDGWMCGPTISFGSNSGISQTCQKSDIFCLFSFYLFIFFAKENHLTKKIPSELVISCRTEQPLASHRTQGTKCDVTSFNYENKCHIINHSWCTSPLRLCELRARPVAASQEVSHPPSPPCGGTESVF